VLLEEPELIGKRPVADRYQRHPIRRYSSTGRSNRLTPADPSARWTRITAATSGQTAIGALTGRFMGNPSWNPRPRGQATSGAPVHVLWQRTAARLGMVGR
jgi:hypothetical protein